MKIIDFIEDDQLIKKILKHLDLWDVKRKPPPREPMWYIRLWRSPPTEAFIIYDESSLPSADDYLIDNDRSTQRLWTGYPIETFKRSSRRHTGEL